MTKCKKCNHPFSFKLVFKLFWTGHKSISCVNCQVQHKFTLEDRLIRGMVVGISTFISCLMMRYFESDIASKLLLGLVSMVILCVALTPLSLSLLTFQLNKKHPPQNRKQ